MRTLVLILAIWFAVSVPVGMIAGKIMERFER
jgi:hypothetical protein